ncbi:uncharacterized protein [Aegilops tauschii subsp. strangulata]|uniref:uncharacterized protein n=1 Tax=Aegilops tauschii subsp. strangulata TaxID=200361 RepID=UPI00098B5BFE|nr:uncharacterized protein LOC109774281 [Aegilops tauschii subsp. strangulata]
METISRYFKQVIYAVEELRGEMIKPPTSRTPTKIRTIPRWYPYFNVSTDRLHWGNRWYSCHCQSASVTICSIQGEHYTSQNVLAAVDFDMKFTYVLAGWEGKTRYHLTEFAGRNYPRTPHELFNLRHYNLRVTVERDFGALKSRFKILNQKPFHTFPTQIKLVLTCCILHNWILQWGVDELVSEEEDVTEDDVVSSGHGVKAFDNEAWKNKRMGWAQAIWDNRGQTRI